MKEAHTIQLPALPVGLDNADFDPAYLAYLNTEAEQAEQDNLIDHGVEIA